MAAGVPGTVTVATERPTRLLLLAESGQGMLDLATLAPQPGFGSTAPAAEDALFDPLDVRTIAFHLAGSGAIDDLSVCLAGQARATVRMRNGAGANPVILAAASRPVLGSTWAADLDCSGFGAGLAFVTIRSEARAGTWSELGEVLIGGALLDDAVGSQANCTRRLPWSIPFDLSLCGLEAHVQGLCWGATRSGTKTAAIRSRLSNALDLVLGF